MGSAGGGMLLNGRAGLGVVMPTGRLGRARGVGNDLGALGVPCGVDVDRVGEAVLALRAPRSVAVMPTYLLARDPAVIVLSSGFLRALARGAAMDLGAGACEGVVRPEMEGVVRPFP